MLSLTSLQSESSRKTIDSRITPRGGGGGIMSRQHQQGSERSYGVSYDYTARVTMTKESRKMKRSMGVPAPVPVDDYLELWYGGVQSLLFITSLYCQ